MQYLLIGLLALVAGVLYLLRRAEVRRQRQAGVTDELLRRIEEHGRVEMDEPLDLEEIQREEDRFWAESWDEPETW